jgi:phenylpropionate dioxygenase-like ring-hydroxylating dioxygenase large terminal subunit
LIKNSSHSEEMTSLVKRALEHFENKTTDQAEGVMPNSIGAYIDPTRYQDEIERVFKNLPLALCLSSEIPGPNCYRAMKVIDTPVLITRGKDLKVRAFLNVCRHRGSKVCEEGSGEKRNFICPYHAWTYDHEGQLVGMYGEKTFGDIKIDEFGLIELNCSEMSGLIWVMLTPDQEFNIDDWLGDFSLELETLNLKDWHIYEQRELVGPGWKVALDGYLEAYHHNQLHGDTVGKHTVGNLLVLDTYGPHQRLTFGRKSLKDLVGKQEADWDAPLDNIRLIHSGFPNLSISGVLGGHCLVSQIFPTASLEKTITRQTILSAKKPSTPEELLATKDFSDMVLQAVVDEDYKIGLEIQENISKLGSNNFVYGRNEPAVQNYHSWIEKFMNSKGSNW